MPEEQEQEAEGHSMRLAPPLSDETTLEEKKNGREGKTGHAVQAKHDDDDEEDPSHAPLPLLCAELYARLRRFLHRPPQAGDDEDQEAADARRRVQGQVRRSLGIIREALRRYSLDELSLSYNGGKDCLVVLILFLAALATDPAVDDEHDDDDDDGDDDDGDGDDDGDDDEGEGARQDNEGDDAAPGVASAVYIEPAHPFPSVDAFVRRSSRHYHLALARYPGPMPAAFAAYTRAHPHMHAVLVGTRRTDPGGARLAATGFDPTDGGWPRFMRVHPVLEWRYGEIWTFLRAMRIPYCPLYDQGYTSLGGTEDTHPNPALRVERGLEGGGGGGGGGEGGGGGGGGGRGGGGEERYRAAYELEAEEDERRGRY
ncbi:MAG: 3'-phosphoadenosine 5'-phosphosulfate sulfotransferase [Phylliscum demangeonii]|nr:MAG: 3'-phosphoadenosine 5'-phosphosulfate sulfotransferase [Phylliscum demangeonii]